jgi:LysR family transcriptional regulator for metE and metH
MVPTAAGKELICSATQVLDLVGRTEDGIKRIAQGKSGVLRISTECYTCYHWLPGLLKEYRVVHPHVDVIVDASATPHPVKSLLEGRLDVAIVSDRVHDRRLVEKPLFEDEMLVVTSPSHPFSSRAYVKAEDFASETLFIYPPKEESTLFQRVLNPAGVSPASLQQIQLTEAILELVKAGLGIAVMAGWAIEPYVRAGTIRAIPLGRRGFRRQWTAAILPEMASVQFVNDFVRLLAKKSPVTRSRPGRRPLFRFERPRSASSRLRLRRGPTSRGASLHRAPARVHEQHSSQ